MGRKIKREPALAIETHTSVFAEEMEDEDETVGEAAQRDVVDTLWVFA